MTKQLSTNQLCCIIMLVTISNKLLALPALMYESLQGDAIFVVFLKLGLAIFPFLLFVWISKRFPNKTLEDLLVPFMGKPLYSLLLFAFLLFYLVKTFLTLKEGEAFLNQTIYVGLSSVLYITSSLVIAGYFVYKGLRTVGRVAEVFLKFILFGVVITLVFALPNVRLEQVLPLFTSSFGSFHHLFSHISIWFGNYFVIFLFLGRVKRCRKFTSKVLVSFCVSALVAVAFYFVYYATFGIGSKIHNFAINDVISLTPQLSSLIKIDWFTVIFYSLALILQVVVQLYFEYYCIKHIFMVKHTIASVGAFVMLFALVYVLVPLSSSNVVQCCFGDLSIYSEVLNSGFPVLVLCAFLKRLKSQKQHKTAVLSG